MNDQHLARLEAHLERLIEGTFAQIFGKAIRAEDVALQLARAMEDNIQAAADGDIRPIAPDTYTILLNPTVQELFLRRQPALAQMLGQHMVEFAANVGFQLFAFPDIRILSDFALGASELRVHASFRDAAKHSTAVLERIVPPQHNHEAPRNSQIIVNGTQIIALDQPIISIGRGRDNTIVLDDPFLSRHHVQLRLRFSCYTLFDANSTGGTFVNNVRVREHRLQTNDVIRIGKSQLVYLEDESSGMGTTGISAIEL